MTDDLKRRDFLKTSAAFAAASAAGGFACAEIAGAAPINPPAVDRLTVRVLIDGSYNLFLRPGEVKGVKIEPPPSRRPTIAAPRTTSGACRCFWRSRRAAEQRTVMLDFGYTPEALLNNMEMVGVDPKKIEALIVSHGHFDHYRRPARLPRQAPQRAPGRPHALCRRRGQFLPPLYRARRASSPNSVRWTAASSRRATSRPCWRKTRRSSGHAFTTGKIKRTSNERVLPNTRVEFAVKDGLGCNASHYTPAELQGKIVPDEHLHEHATCFNVKDRGLVVISSCGHVGIVNSARQAQEVSGVQKVHALVGGFHLGPAPADYLDQVIAEIKALDPDVIVPMHCSGDNFIRAVRAQMPDKLLVATTGAALTFGA